MPHRAIIIKLFKQYIFHPSKKFRTLLLSLVLFGIFIACIFSRQGVLMETVSAYQSYLTAMQNYQTSQGRIDYQAPFANGFEAIYNKAKDEDVSLSDAKAFLENLSSSEINTLQKYSGLADAVNVGALSSEGAYNLLLHDNEQYDFNNDGVAEVGIGKHLLPVPTNMPSDVREAYITAMNSLEDKDKLMAMTLSFDPARLNSILYNEPYTPTKIDYNFLKEQVNTTLNPIGGGYTSQETKASTLAFWNAFNAAFTGDKTPSDVVEATDSTVAQFLKNLRTKGAATFLADLNQEKINKLVEEYKQKLIESMGDSPEAMKEIAALVADYKTQLMEEMKEKMEEEAKNKEENIAPISSNTFVQQLLDIQQKKTTNPLEELLQS